MTSETQHRPYKDWPDQQLESRALSIFMADMPSRKEKEELRLMEAEMRLRSELAREEQPDAVA